MDNEPLWLDVERPEFDRPERAERYDVLVIGGGITGLTAAFLLKQAGKTVCLLEKGRIGGGETGHTSAHLTAATDLRLSRLARTFGTDAAGLVWHAGATAIDLIESLSATHQIDCDFHRVPGFLHAAIPGGEDETDQLQEDCDTAQRLGVSARYVAVIPGVRRPGVMFSDQARFQPVKYSLALARLVAGGGSCVREQSEVSEVEDQPLSVRVNGTRIECGRIVVATHVPLQGAAGFLGATLTQSKLYPYSSYVVSGTVPRGAIPDALYWDTSNPYYYLRLIPGEGETDRVVFGGADHKTGQETETRECYRNLEATLRLLFPHVVFDRRWCGQVIETNDGLPFMGETAAGQFAATGFSGNGLTFGALAGMMACDWALERENPWQELFSIDRKQLRGGTWDYLVENLDYPRYLIGDWLTRGGRADPEQLARGEGRVLKLDGRRVACARDGEGTLSKVSAVCPHMGCLVRWNRAEETWDCPCHGSRFAPTGEVIGGPAESPLEKWGDV